ncbi:MAG TPA: ATP-dependent zinc metalloprotease FtsH [Bacilli bacterium]|nr:ATP-dependent zinc metalloprotease FtsH [Bacilli bacterium]
MKKRNSIIKGILPYIIIFCLFAGIYFAVNILNKKVNTFTYNEFVGYLDKKEVTTMEITPKYGSQIYEIKGKLVGYEENETYLVKIPYSEIALDEILSYSNTDDIEVNVEKDPSSSSFLTILINVVPFLLLGILVIVFLNKQVGGAGKSFDFGKSKAKLSNGNDKDKVTFKDVAGLDEEKEEVSELIDFLQNPKKFQKLGARIPKGVLLVGPPGTGKTLLARAVAGEANVPFYYISGSDFVELFVGIGASRVRDMFKEAKKTAPCLIFIDEIDAVGRQRGTGLGGGHDEREQTLNQLLTEMDGFGVNEGIIIIAATNRPDVLDPALLRPGRFDRQITVNLPDVKGREEILGVHAKNKILSPNVKLHNLAKRTVGFSGADLENLLNEAALLAVRRNKQMITMSELDEAHDRVLMGPAKVSRQISDDDKKITAYHEAGHVIVGIKLENSNIVQKVTIIPRGMAGGYTNIQSEEEKAHVTKTELIETISTLLAGRVTEKIVFNEITTGASNDIERATKIARAMVTEYGMSDLGPMQLEQPESSIFLGRDYNKSRNFSDKVAFEIDNEMRKIIDECYDKSEKIINKNMKDVDLIAENLLKYETLTKEQIDYLLEHGEMPEEEKVDNMTLTELKDLAKQQGIKGYSTLTKEEIIAKLK